MLAPDEGFGQPAMDERQPFAAFVGRAFRIGSQTPLLVAALLVALAAPAFTIHGQTANAVSTATLVDGIITNELSHFLQQLERVAALQGAGEPDPESSQSRSNQLLLSEDHVDSVLIADIEGNVVASASRLTDTVAPRADREALKWITSTSEVFVGMPQFNPIHGRQAVVLAVPIDSPRGERRGMLQLVANTDFVIHAINRANQSLGTSSYIITETGRVLVHNDEWRILNGQQLNNVQNGLRVGLDGELRIMGVIPTEAWGEAIQVVSTAPLSIVFPGAALGLVPIAFGLASFGVSRRARRQLVKAIAVPIHDLEKAVGSYGPDNLRVRAGGSSVTELYNVALSFNRTADTIDSLVVSLSRSNEELAQFASVAAHDLQEPMRKVRTFGDLLATAPDSELTDEQQGYIDRMQDAATRMQQLIDDLLAYSRLTNPDAPFQRVDLNETVVGVLDDLEYVITEAAAEVAVDKLPVVVAEPTEMRQLMQNLISNSIKFRRNDTPPRVHITGHSGPNGQATISVADNGVGFEPKYAERIFGVFERLHGRSEYPGTGIGLALCRKIVERHGGTITAEGTAGEGATFTFTLPTDAQ